MASVSSANEIKEESKNHTNSEFTDPLQSIKKEWVKFDDENSSSDNKEENSASVAPQQTFSSNKNTIDNQSKLPPEISSSPAVIEIPNNNISQLSTVELPRRKNDHEGLGEE